jgi:hypothetical protein
MAKALANYLELQNIKHLKTSGFHPRTNGKTERYNGLLGTILTKLVGPFKRKWDKFLPQALFATRIRIRNVTKRSPFSLVYGFEPRISGDPTPPHLWKHIDEDEMAAYNQRVLQDI